MNSTHKILMRNTVETALSCMAVVIFITEPPQGNNLPKCCCAQCQSFIRAIFYFIMAYVKAMVLLHITQDQNKDFYNA